MPKLHSGADCCGCTACASICSAGAILMEPDALGFLYPIVDATKCKDCGACEKVCSFNQGYERSHNLSCPDVYGAQHKDIDEVKGSRSGAAFVAMSDYVLEHGGVVYGAGYKDHFRVAHKRAVSKRERDEFRGSKYVQSDMSGVFNSVKRDLIEGKIVLFSGTPCQTSGLNSFLGPTLREKIVLVDIICHGVPGPFLWRDFLLYVERLKKDTVTSVCFRNKKIFGWADHRESFVFSLHPQQEVYFKGTFYKDVMIRRSCGKCPYANTVRPSDITIGDFWGWEKHHPHFDSANVGVSLIIVNTPKGRDFFSCIKADLRCFRSSLEESLQPNLQAPTRIHPFRDQFETAYVQRGFEYAYKKFGNPNRCLVRRLISSIKRFVKERG